MTISERLTELHITLPAPAKPLGSYVPARRHGALLYLSGHLPRRDGQVVHGRVGAEVGLEIAQQMARKIALELVATAAEAAGGVDRLAGVVKLVGFVRSAPGFTKQPLVLNGASDVLVEIFGDAGRHARSAIGVSELPMGAVMEIEAIFTMW